MRLKIIVCVLMYFSSSCFELNAAEGVDSILISDVHSSFDDLEYIGDEILHASSASLMKAGIVIGTSILAMQLDEDMRTISQKNAPFIDRNLISLANGYGELMYPAIGTITMYGLGLAFSDEEVRLFSRKTCTSLLVAGAMTTIIKSMIGRSRPYLNQGNHVFTPFNINDGTLSYPSGHTTVAFVMSASLSRYIDRWWADILLYGLATGTAYARMHHDKHWLSDTVLGGAIGYFVTQWVYESDKNPSNSSSKATIVPQIAPNSLGILVQF